MNRLSSIVCFLFFSLPLHALTSARIVKVIDARTVVVSSGTSQTNLVLDTIDAVYASNPAAITYLYKISGTPLFAEEGKLYAPDGRYINDEVRRILGLMPVAIEHHTMTYLGEIPPVLRKEEPAPKQETIVVEVPARRPTQPRRPRLTRPRRMPVR